MKALGRFIFWEFPRATWQYDVIVAAILAFIFLTPRDVFRDQPRAANIQLLTHGYWIEARLLASVPEAEQPAKASELVNDRFKDHKTIARVEPVFDESEKEITGYMAYTKP